MTAAGSGQGDGRRRALIAWCVYDWASSSFPTVVSTFVFSAYFTQVVAQDPTTGTALWGQTVTVAAIAIALLSPVLGAVADRGGRRKPWLAFFASTAVVATAVLWFVRPEPADIPPALVLVGLATIGFELAGVFYNAMLPDLAPAPRLGRISGWAWSLGYAGGLTCLAVSLLVFVRPQQPPFGLDKAAYEHVRATVLLVAAWFAVFALPLFLLTPDRPASGVAPLAAVRQGLAALVATLRRLGDYRDVARFLLARMIYADGLNTLFAFGGIYAAGTFGMKLDEVLMFGILLNVASGLGAALFAWVDDWLGAKPTIAFALVALMLFGLGALLVEDKAQFYVFGLGLGVFVGPVGSASRSLMARLAPPDLATEFFGLYALVGKATAFVGPALFGWATHAFSSQRAGMASILPFFAVGLLLLLRVREPQSADGQNLPG